MPSLDRLNSPEGELLELPTPKRDTIRFGKGIFVVDSCCALIHGGRMHTDLAQAGEPPSLLRGDGLFFFYKSPNSNTIGIANYRDRCPLVSLRSAGVGRVAQ